MICPKCKQDRARRTERVGGLDNALNRLYIKPYSCHACRHRFHALREDFSLVALRMQAKDRLAGWRFQTNRRRRERELVIFALAAVALIAAIYFLTQLRG